MTQRSVVFLAFDGMKHLDVAGPAEVFAEATRLGGGYRLRYVSADGLPTRTSIGAGFPVDGRAADIDRADIAVVPGGDRLPVSPADPGVLGAVTHLAQVGRTVVSVCTGAFLLAATGVLDGRRATTHWEHAARLGRFYPHIDVSSEALFVRDGKFHTSAGVTAGIDLALSLVEADRGAEFARDVARQLVVYMQRQGGQSQFSSMLQFPRSSRDDVRRVMDAVIADPAAEHTVDGLARIAGVGPRHLTRLFRAETGTTPGRFVEQVRLETAKSLLVHGESVAATAQRAGFGSSETMRRAFVSQLGMPPSAYRERFSCTTA